MKPEEITDLHRMMAESLFPGPQPKPMPLLDLDAIPPTDDDICSVLMCPPEFRGRLDELTQQLRRLDLNYPAHIQEAQRIARLAEDGVDLASKTSSWDRDAGTNDALPVLNQTEPIDHNGTIKSPPAEDRPPKRSIFQVLTELSALLMSFLGQLVLRS